METAIDGLQGPPGHLGDRDRVLATAKHFAGDGDTTYGTSTGDDKIDQGIASPTVRTSGGRRCSSMCQPSSSTMSAP